MRLNSTLQILHINQAMAGDGYVVSEIQQSHIKYISM